jgi:hypothetical protein
MDELRIWNRALEAAEIKNNYDRYISGKEDGLLIYYRFDEPDGQDVYDISGTDNGTFNENHGMISAIPVRSQEHVPTGEQLAIKGVTNNNGHYLINTIPYFGNGSQYVATPMLGVHTFNPTNKPLYFSQSSSTHNNVDFTDVSSFKVSGYVYYEGGNYPVADCTFEVDGAQAMKNNTAVKSSVDGYFEINVPIGIHKVQVKKNGHTFIADGLLINESTNENINYNTDLNNIKFYDQTRVKLIGHIVGGKREHTKTSGFGLRENNINSDALILTAARKENGCYFLYNMNTLSVVTEENVFLHNTNDKWAKWNRDSWRQDTTKMRVSGSDITIHVSPTTGEFVAWVYPELYTIQNFSAGSYGEIYSRLETFDLRNAPVSDDLLLQKSVLAWQDSVYVPAQGSMQAHYEQREHEDTVLFHKEWGYFHQEYPSYTIEQLVNMQPVIYFGETEYKMDNDTVVPLLTENGNTVNYTFGAPVFRRGEPYAFKLKAFEKYYNSKNQKTDIVPVAGGQVSFYNDLATVPYPDPIALDTLGENMYTFIGGIPNFETGKLGLSTSIILDNISYSSTTFGNSNLEAYLLGGKGTGTDFLTAATDRVDFILHDPPGTGSSAYIEQGSSVTNTHKVALSEGFKYDMSMTAQVGVKTIILTGAFVIAGSEAVDFKEKLGGKLETEIDYLYNHTYKTTHTFTDKFETSSTPSFVGHQADIFVGTGTNTLYGLTNNVTIDKTTEFADPQDVLLTIGDYTIGKQRSLSFGDHFETMFAYTGYDVENVMIPKWKNALKTLFIFDLTGVDPDLLQNPVYYSKLPPTHPNFGKRNDDPVFGTAATSDYSLGLSYEMILPTALKQKMIDGMKYDPDADSEVIINDIIRITDSVAYFNNQIGNWEKILADNEKRKVTQQYEAGNNISFSSGVKVQKSQKIETSSEHEHGISAKHNILVVAETGAKMFNTGVDISIESGYVGTESSLWGEEHTNNYTIGFELNETGITDEITLDWGLDNNNDNGLSTYIFKTRGGRTSCPYEGEVVTKYYEPGTVMQVGTMQIEVPKIAVLGNSILTQVPADRPASFLLSLTNQSETNGSGLFKLTVDESTNPYGAVLKIDGTPIGNGRNFYVSAGSPLTKTLTVEKGPDSLSYQNIRLLFTSDCDDSLADATQISVSFIPSCCEVSIKYPSDKWILNTATGDSILVELENYDVNYSHFGYVELQYRPIWEAQWRTEMKFYSDLASFVNATEPKTFLTGTEQSIKHYWRKDDTKPDGGYEFRARTICEANGMMIAENYSPVVTGTVDMRLPVALGAPSPANGILGIGDELSITFNEDIQTGKLNSTFFKISGILNEQEIAEPNVGLAFSGIQSAQTELPIFTNGSFSIETWFKREPNTAGTLFAFGSNNNYISLGFDAAGHAVLKIGNETYTSSNTIENDETWRYIAMSYDRDLNEVSVFKFEGSSNDYFMFYDHPLITMPETQGKLIVGNNAETNDGFSGAIAQLHCYGINRTLADAAAGKSVMKSGREYGLIGYWLLDEGEGSVAKDKARSRHLILNNTGWYIYPAGYAKYTDNTYFAIPTGAYPLDKYHDLTLEFWFRSMDNNGQTDNVLFCTDNGYLAINDNGGLSLYKKGFNVEDSLIRVLTTGNLMDTKWRHIALSVRRNGNVNLYIDGENKAIFSENLLGNFSSSGHYYFGAKYENGNVYSQYFKGYFDELRIWNSALTREGILLNKNNKLHGDEAGLLAYYPFEAYWEQNNGLITVTPIDHSVATSSGDTLTGTAQTTNIAIAVKNVRPIEQVPFSYVASNNKIVFTLHPNHPSFFARVEGVTLNISVAEVYDLCNNKCNPEHWTAFVKRNPLQWDTDPIYIKMQEGENRTFTAKITNVGGTTLSYNIENLPSWLSVNNPVGNLQPLASRDLTFTVYQGVNIGNYEAGIGLTSGNGVVEILPVQLKVTGVRPDWDVNPYDFETSMNIIGRMKIDGTFQEDTDDLLGAFIGDLCVGVTSPAYVEAYNAYYTFSNIYGNTEHNNQPLTFKLWDASTGRIYPVIETSIANIVFAPSTMIGTITNPVIFNALNLAEQVIVLNKGWNWISTNVLNDDPTILNQMKLSLVDVGVQIKGRNTYIQQPGWAGSLTEISEKAMYAVNTNNNHTLVLMGEYAQPAATPIPIDYGWNWIGYIPSCNLPVNDAVAGLDAQTGDQIKGQLGFATYTGASGWVGNLSYMQAGRGYMYYSNNAIPQTLIYPTTRGLQMPDTETEDDPYIASRSVTSIWTPNITQFSNTMTMTAMVKNSGVELYSEWIEIGAFCGNDCRGSALLQYVGELDQYIGFMMIYGSGNESITLKVYDHETNTEYTANNDPLIFVSDAILGDPFSPYIIALGAEPFDVTLSNLTVSEGILTPVFNSNILTYTVNVPYSVNSITLTGTPTDNNATVIGNGVHALIVGANLFSIIVTAPDGVTTLTYTVTVTRGINTADATLSNLTVSSGTLTPAFSSVDYNYTVNVDYNVTSITLTGTPTDANALVIGNGLKQLLFGSNLFTITVIAQDSVTML